MPGGVLRESPTVVTLVQEEPGLLPLSDIDDERQSVFFDRNCPFWLLTANETILDLKSLQLPNALLRTQPDALRRTVFFQEVEQNFLSLGQSQACQLNHQPVSVPIDGQAGQAVGFAVDQSAGGRRFVLNIIGSQSDSIFDSLIPEGSIQRRILVPRVQPNSDVAVRVEQASRDELSAVVTNDDLIARFGIPGNAQDRAGENPRMLIEKRQRAFLLEGDGGQRFDRDGRRIGNWVHNNQLVLFLTGGNLLQRIDDGIDVVLSRLKSDAQPDGPLPLDRSQSAMDSRSAVKPGSSIDSEMLTQQQSQLV